MRNRARLNLLLGLLVLNTLNGCGSKAEIADAPYPVIDTGYWSYDVLTLPLWLDNDRLMFASTDSLTPDNSAMRLKVLNTQTGQVISTPFQTAFCVRNGIALFQQKDELTGKTTDYRGTPENYHPEPQHPDDERFDTTFDCDWVPKATFAQWGHDQFPAKVKLRGDNYIEILEPRTRLSEHQKRPRDREREKQTGDLGSPGKAFYHTNANARGAKIPIRLWQYSELLDAYVSSGYYDPREPETSSFSILHRNGELEEISYPKTMLQGNNDVYPIKNGFLVHHDNGAITETDHGDGGLYLIQGEHLQRLIIGTFGHVVVSPDGCKAAIAHAYTIKEDLMKSSKRTIKFINFCQRDSKS